MTAEQLETMFSFLEQHPQLAKGRLRDLDGRVKASRLWQELADTLNSMGGTIKTVKQWQRSGTNRRPVESGRSPTNSPSARLARSLHSSRPECSPLASSPDRSPLRPDRSPLRPDHSALRPDRSALRPDRSTLRPDRSPVASRPECSPQIHQSIQVTSSPGVTGGLTAARTPSRREQAPANQNARGRGRQWRPPRTLLARTSALATASSSSISSRLFRLEEERVRAETERAKELREIREAVVALNETMRDFLHAFVESTASRTNQ